MAQKKDCKDIQDEYARRRNKKKREKRNEVNENADAQEELGLYYDTYNGWCKDDR